MFQSKNWLSCERNPLPGLPPWTTRNSLPLMPWASSSMAHASPLAVTSSRPRANTKIVRQAIARCPSLSTISSRFVPGSHAGSGSTASQRSSNVRDTSALGAPSRLPRGSPGVGGWKNRGPSLPRSAPEKSYGNDVSQDLCQQVQQWQDHRNQRVGTVDWQFRTTDERIKLKRLYPVQQPDDL